MQLCRIRIDRALAFVTVWGHDRYMETTQPTGTRLDASTATEINRQITKARRALRDLEEALIEAGVVEGRDKAAAAERMIRSLDARAMVVEVMAA